MKLDIIIPTFELFKNFPLISKKLNPDWLPVWSNRKKLKKLGLNLIFHDFLNLDVRNLSTNVAIDNRIILNFNTRFKNAYTHYENLLITFIKKIKKKSNKLLYFDNKDSAAIQPAILPYVDKYYKGKLYKDLTLYEKQNLLGNGKFTDFYVRNYQIKTDSFFDLNRTLSVNDLKRIERNKNIFKRFQEKINLSWNVGFKDYRQINGIESINLYKRFFINKIIPHNIHLNFYPPSLKRYLDLSANFSYNYSSNIIGFQRREFLRILIKLIKKKKKKISIGKVSRRQYYKNLETSKAILSPFGWGGICYRDFEALIYGAALVKPNMDYLNTWPNIYKKNETYIPLSWEIEEWEKEILKILEDEENLARVGKKGQDLYKDIISEKGLNSFCKRFKNLVSF